MRIVRELLLICDFFYEIETELDLKSKVNMCMGFVHHACILYSTVLSMAKA